MMKIILCRNVTEGNAFSREQGWRPGSYRVALRAASIRGIRESEVHELPSFEYRLDRHAVMAELRYNRGPHFLHEDWTQQSVNRGPVQPELPFDTSVTVASPSPEVAATTSEPHADEAVVAKARQGTRKAQTKPRRATIEDL